MDTTSNAPDIEPLSSAVARRLRGRMGELQLKGTEVAALIGMTQGSFSRRYTGAAAWELDELQRLEAATGIRIAFLLGLEDVEQPATAPIARVEPAPAAAPAPPADRPPVAGGDQPRLMFLDPTPIRFDSAAWPGAMAPAAAS